MSYVDNILHKTLIEVGFRNVDCKGGYKLYVEDGKIGGSHLQNPRQVRVIPGQTPYAMKHVLLSHEMPELARRLRSRRLNVEYGEYFTMENNGDREEWPSILIW